MSAEIRQVSVDGIRHRRPDMTDAEVNSAVRQLLLHEW